MARVLGFVSAMVILLGTYAYADTLNFTGVDVSVYDSTPVPVNYGGLQWSEVFVFKVSPCAGVKYEYSFTGYCNFMDHTGIDTMAYTYGEFGSGRLATISYGDGLFDFNSATLATAWENDVVATFTGYRKDQIVATKTVSLNTGYDHCVNLGVLQCSMSQGEWPTHVTFGWDNVDKVTISSVGGHSDGIGGLIFPGWEQTHVIIGDLDVDLHPASTPEPTSLLYLGTGTLVAAQLVRRRLR